jgi:hypothetical protein
MASFAIWHNQEFLSDLMEIVRTQPSISGRAFVVLCQHFAHLIPSFVENVEEPLDFLNLLIGAIQENPGFAARIPAFDLADLTLHALDFLLSVVDSTPMPECRDWMKVGIDWILRKSEIDADFHPMLNAFLSRVAEGCPDEFASRLGTESFGLQRVIDTLLSDEETQMETSLILHSLVAVPGLA